MATFPINPAEGEVFAVGRRLYVYHATTGWQPSSGNVTPPAPGDLPAIYDAINLRAPKLNPVFQGTVQGVTKAHVGLPNVDNTADLNKPVSTAQALNARQRFASSTTTGTLDWNHATNCVPGVGPVLLTGNATNGPTTGGEYYHPFNIEFGGGNGTGNMTQLAIAYGNRADDIWMRGRYSGTWTAWRRVMTTSNASKAMVGLGNVDNTADASKPISTAQAAVNALKANLASPPLTGTPTAPTAAPGTNTTQIANTQFVAAAVAAAIAGMLNSAPATLDTLDELAAALGDDPNFATTMATALGNRLRFDSAQTLTAAQKTQGQANLGIPAELNLKLDKAGGTMTGDLAITNTTFDTVLALNKASTTKAVQIQAKSGGTTRWIFDLAANDAEGTNNVGSSFSIHRYGNTGTYLGTPFSISRSTGRVTLTSGLYVSGGQIETEGILVSNPYQWPVKTSTFLQEGVYQRSLAIDLSSHGDVSNIVGYHQPGVVSFIRINAGGAGNYWDFKNNGVATSIGGWSTISDERMKKDIVPAAADRAAFRAIKPITFTYIMQDPDMPEPQPVLGFSAQNLASVFPPAVEGDVTAVDEEGKPKPASIKDMAILALTVMEVQALTEDFAALRARVAELEKS